MTVSTAGTIRAAPQAPRSVPRRRLLEDKRWLAFVLLVPTMVMLCLFIAYPFAHGCILSVTDSPVGVPEHFVGPSRSCKIWNDCIFHVWDYNDFLNTAL